MVVIMIRETWAMQTPLARRNLAQGINVRQNEWGLVQAEEFLRRGFRRFDLDDQLGRCGVYRYSVFNRGSSCQDPQ